MGMTRRQKGFVGVAVLGVAAVGVDRLVLLPGPASASAASVMETVREHLDLSKLEARATQLVKATIEAEVLDAMKQGDPSFDAFNPEAMKQLQAALAGERVAAPVAVEAKAGGPRDEPRTQRVPALTAVVSRGSGGIAVLDGKTLSVGETRDGMTLVGVTARSATVRIGGREYTLSLPVAGNIKKKSDTE